MLGDTYTVVDMALWAWARLTPFVLGQDVAEKMTNLKRLVDEVTARPAAQRALALKERHRLQGGDGRRGAQVHVPAERESGGLTDDRAWDRGTGPGSLPTLVSDGVCATIRLNRPALHNRIEPEDLAELARLLAQADADRRCACWC